MKAALSVLLVLCLTPAATPRAQADAPRVAVDSSAFDFGRIPQGGVVSHDFILRNDGGRELKISDIQMSMPGMKLRLRRIVPPMAEIKLGVEWATDRLSGEVEGQVYLQTDDPINPEVVLTLKGIVIPPIEVTPFAAVFFSLYQGESGEQSVTILNHQQKPIRLSGIDPKDCQCGARLETIEEGREYRLSVSISGDVPPGRYRRALAVATDDPAHPSIDVGVNLFVKSDVYANPEDVDFGRVKLADLAGRPNMLALLTQTFIVKKREGELGITGVVTDLPFLAITRDPPGRSQIHRFDVGLDFEKLAAGPIDGSIRITTDDPRFPELIIPVRGILE